MSKTPVSWAFQELVTSSKLTEMVTDYVTKGQLVCNTGGGIYTGNTGATTIGTIPLGMWTFNPAKQTADRMRILASARAYGGGAAWCQIQYTINAGAAWVVAPLANALPFALPAVTYGATAMSLDTSIDGYDDIDISGVGATTHFGWQVWNWNAATGAIGYWVTVLLYNSVDTPF